MAETLRDVMTRNPATLDSEATVAEAARLMRDRDIGDVLVTDSGAIRGIVTDRDLVVRVLADGRDPAATPLAAIASEVIESLTPTASAQDALDLMIERTLRRISAVQ